MESVKPPSSADSTSRDISNAKVTGEKPVQESQSAASSRSQPQKGAPVQVASKDKPSTSTIEQSNSGRPHPPRPATTSSSHKFKEMGNLSKFKILQKLGQGTFGVVQKAEDRETHKTVALKQLLNHSAKEGFPITAMREITILKQLHHKNILELIDMVYEAPKVTNPSDMIHQRGCFYTVSPYMCSDLVGLLKNPNIKLQVPHIKCFMQQLLQGIQYIHSQKFLHRDIKAANILVDYDGILKIADFGLARVYHGKVPTLGHGPGGGERQYTGLVVTRWYRPPELLLGEKKYTTAVDLWGIGCVFGELFTHQPILVGKSDSHQAQLVFELLGAPNTITWPDAIKLPNKSDFSIGITCKRTLESRFEKLISPEGIDLLSGLLTLDPYKRMNALDALNHEYFKIDPLPMKPGELPKFEESHEIDTERFKQMKQVPQSQISSNNNGTSTNKNNTIPPTAPFQQQRKPNGYRSGFASEGVQRDSYVPKSNNSSWSDSSNRFGSNRDSYVPQYGRNGDSQNRTRDAREYDSHSADSGYRQSRQDQHYPQKRPYSSSFEQKPKFVPSQPRGMFMSQRRPHAQPYGEKRRKVDDSSKQSDDHVDKKAS